MNLSALLGIEPGERVAVLGAGGKTALVGRLAGEMAGVVVAPTTRIGFDQVRVAPGVRYVGRAVGEKFVAAPMAEIEAAARGAALTLMEADGSRGLMLKGWAAHEPVVPDFTTLTAFVVSARAVGLAATDENVHRLPLFLRQTGVREGDSVDADALARMIRYAMDRHAVGRSAIFINQVEGAALIATAQDIARALCGFGGQILAGSLKEGTAWRT